MKILVINCGSSSIKYELYDMPRESSLAEGAVSRVGGEAELEHRCGDSHLRRSVSSPDHAAGMRHVMEALTAGDSSVLRRPDDIDAVAHRVVHSGCESSAPAVIDDEVLAAINRGSALAPLHNPPNVAGIEAAREAVPRAAHVAVFDTAFFASLPEHAFRYAVPESWCSEHHVRKYGFHGSSHQYVALRAAELLGRPPEQTNLITVHLGGGSSVTAVRDGSAVDHSMGMTPMEGLMMGTRSGDLDPGVVLYMQRRGLTVEEVDQALNFESGLLGVGGVGSDMRDVLGAAGRGTKRASLAVEMFVYRVVKYIGAYYAILPRVDAVVLTGGIGENAWPIRRRIIKRLERLGAVADEARDKTMVGGAEGAITADGAKLPVWVVPTDEELMMARITFRTLADRTK